MCDIGGILHPDRPHLEGELAAMALRTNPRGLHGRADDALAGADVVIGVSAPGAFTAEGVRTMAPDAIVFAMANPTPEVQPEAVWEDVAIMATGRSDYPNQINNVLAFPGVFKGALQVRARTINDDEARRRAARSRRHPESELGPSTSSERLQPHRGAGGRRRRGGGGDRGGRRRATECRGARPEEADDLAASS